MKQFTKTQMENYLTDAGWILPSVIDIEVNENYYCTAEAEIKDKRKTLNQLRFVAKQTDDSRRILIPYVEAYADLLSSIETVPFNPSDTSSKLRLSSSTSLPIKVIAILSSSLVTPL